MPRQPEVFVRALTDEEHERLLPRWTQNGAGVGRGRSVTPLGARRRIALSRPPD